MKQDDPFTFSDIGGQLAAYNAYRTYVKKELNGKEEDLLPGLERFTPNQIFWITYGFSWCMTQTDENLAHQLLTNEHAPGICRVNQGNFGCNFMSLNQTFSVARSTGIRGGFQMQRTKRVSYFGLLSSLQHTFSMYPPDEQR
jgi:predicted metalloendopeptidase